MLVLSRKKGESIVIDGDIVVTVVDIRGDKVRLGIAAPVETTVHRQEVYDAIANERRTAANAETTANAEPSPSDAPTPPEVPKTLP